MKYHKMQQSKFRLPVTATDATSGEDISLSKSLISPLTGEVMSLTGLLFDLTMTSIDSLVSDHCRSLYYEHLK